MKTGYDLVWLAAQRTPQRLALVDDRTARALTYEKLIHEVDVVAAGLLTRGVRPNEIVAVILPNSFEHCLLILALQRINAIPAMMNYRLSPEEIVALVEDGGIRHAIIQGDQALVDLVCQVPSVTGAVVIVGSGANGLGFEACRTEPGVLPPISAPSADQTAFIMYTSGTTGRPKGVLIPHRASESRMTCLAPMIGFECDDDWRVLGAAPIYHAIGFYLVLMHALAFNGTYFVMSSFDPENALNMIERHRITFLFGVPTMFHAIHSAKSFSRSRVRSVRKLAYGGAPMAHTTLEAMVREWSAQIYHMYGSTEMLASLYNRRPIESPTAFDVGLYHQARVVRVGGRPEEVVDEKETGEIIIDMGSSHMFTGYWFQPGADAAKIREGWYYTGDVGIKLPNGRIALTGRTDNMIRSGAESIYPEEVEEILERQQDVRECCVIGIPDPHWGQKVVACVVPSAATPSLDSLKRYLKAAGLASFKAPKEILIVDALPRNGSGKLVRGAVKEIALNALLPRTDRRAVA